MEADMNVVFSVKLKNMLKPFYHYMDEFYQKKKKMSMKFKKMLKMTKTLI